MIQVAVAVLVVVIIWLLGGPAETTKTLALKGAATLVIALLLPFVFARKLIIVPAVMDAELRGEADELRIPEGGPQPDWTMRELFVYLEPHIIDQKSDGYEAVGSDVLDKVASGHLTLWGREQISRVINQSQWSALYPIAPSHCKSASFSYGFLVNIDERSRLRNAGPNGLTEFIDLHVNRAEVKRLWPRSGR